MNSGRVCIALAMLAMHITANAAVVYREADDGELSSNGLAPTAIAIGAGSNQIFGRMGGGGGGADRDYFVVTVPTDMRLTALNLLGETRVIGVSFIGMQAGSQLTVNPLAGSANGLLGWYHYGASDIGTDILPAIGRGFGASGFTPPLSAGSYAFWLQETGTGSVTYGLDLQVQPLQAVPLPSALGSFALALGLLRRRRSS
ncbi:MAG TPA: hypothetical protein PJ986_11520 [Gammaproteobacteria bacterium]|nr:hypothetical protein [Gammaproteobacteria bacterium]